MGCFLLKIKEEKGRTSSSYVFCLAKDNIQKSLCKSGKKTILFGAID
jgi:hypothetical protein